MHFVIGKMHDKMHFAINSLLVQKKHIMVNPGSVSLLTPGEGMMVSSHAARLLFSLQIFRIMPSYSSGVEIILMW